MSAARQSHREPARQTPAAAKLAQLRTRRRQARRTRRLARVDIGLGAFGALVLLIASPGLAITGLIALLVLATCLISALVQRRIRWRTATAPLARSRAGSSTHPPA